MIADMLTKGLARKQFYSFIYSEAELELWQILSEEECCKNAWNLTQSSISIDCCLVTAIAVVWLLL